MIEAMIRLAVEGRVARLSIDRPAARNALDMAGWAALAGAVARVAASPARVLILGGGGPFCAGSDLGEIARLADDAAGREPFRQAMRTAIDPLAALPIPAIAAIGGDCYGAGVALALACDIRIAAPAARFAVPPARLGIAYPHRDVMRLAAAVGRERAARLLLSGDPVDAAEARRIGLIGEVADDVDAAALTLANRIAANAPEAVVALKASLDDVAPGPSDARFDTLLGRPAFREGLAAQRERRPPTFD